MSVLNPSRFPIIGSSSRSTGTAVHTAAPPLHSRPEDVAEEPDTPTHFPGRHHAERHRKRHERTEEAKQEGLVPLSLPIPDLRFEQGYLLSLAPFLHLDETAPSSPSLAPPRVNEKGKEKEEEREERREVEEQSALVEDAASRPNAPSLYLNPNLRVEWGMVMYVTLRDQLFWPLVQGAFWGTASLLLGQIWASRSSVGPLFGSRRRNVPSARPSGDPPGKMVGEPRGVWERFVGSVWGGIETNAALGG